MRFSNPVKKIAQGQEIWTFSGQEILSEAISAVGYDIMLEIFVLCLLLSNFII